jgi:predicted phosphodiesterase
MSKIIHFTDPHYKDKAPITRTDDYAKALIDKTLKISKLAKKVKAKAVFCGGDVFDVKDSIKISYWLTNTLIQVFKEFPCPVYSLIGNHDITYDRLDTIGKQPLGTLFESGALKHLDKVVIDDVEIIGLDFTPANKTEIEHFVIEKKENKQIIIAHHNLFLGQTQFYDEKAISYEQLSEVVNADIILNGHIHYPVDGKYIVKLNNKYFVNPGSLSRGSLTDDNLDRNVQVVLIDTEEMVPELVNLQVAPASEVFNIQAKEERKEKSRKIEEFVDNLKEAVVSTDGDDIVSVMSSLKLKKLVKERVEHYLSLAAGA